MFRSETIQDNSGEKLIFCEVILSVIVRKKCLYEHVSNSDWLQRYSCLNLQIKKHCEW
jgi:hypothetical protein